MVYAFTVSPGPLVIESLTVHHQPDANGPAYSVRVREAVTLTGERIPLRTQVAYNAESTSGR